ncbi:MAG: ion transporter [Pseudomonadales bacterium]|nr:ion transporter [Pseudomonadales bacterium]
MQNIKKRTFEILNVSERDDRLSRVIDIFLITLISINVISVILETLPSLQNKHQTFFDNFETVSVVIFSIEYLARVWSAVENTERDYSHPFLGRLRYMITPMALIDLIVIMPLYLGFFVAIDLRFMRVLRLLRVFRLTRYSSSMSVLLKVLSDEARAIGAALFVLCMLIIMASSLTYLAEHDAQPEAFGSIPAAMWWAVITMTGVGYGDVTPITAIGKILAAIISIISIGIVALPAGLLASGFSEALRQRRAHYEKLVEDVMMDGVITSDEEAQLKNTQANLGLNADEAEIIIDASRNRQIEKDTSRVVNSIEQEMKIALNNRCPHCGEVVDWRVEKRKNEQ